MNPNFNPDIGKKTQYSSNNQPSRENKSKGWEKHRTIKEYIARYLRMSAEDFKNLQNDIQENPKNYTMMQISAISYVARIPTKERYMFDHRDREEGKPIQQTINLNKDISEENEETIKELAQKIYEQRRSNNNT